VSIAGIVLAAGSSSRLGRPKQTVMLGGETLVERAVRVAQEAGLSPVIVVIADATLMDGLQQMGATVLFNEKAFEGMASSIRLGVSRVKDLNASGVVLMTCDQFEMQSEHLRVLCDQSERVAGSGYAGKRGIPAYFPASVFDGLLQLHGDVGARELLQTARVVVDESLAFDIDTEEDLARAHTRSLNT
jgi:molybdenum cofactor cytidylyltransferase